MTTATDKAHQDGRGPRCRSLEDAWRGVFPNIQGKDMGNYGHFLQWETPEDTNQEIMDFFSR